MLLDKILSESEALPADEELDDTGCASVCLTSLLAPECGIVLDPESERDFEPEYDPDFEEPDHEPEYDLTTNKCLKTKPFTLKKSHSPSQTTTQSHQNHQWPNE